MAVIKCKMCGGDLNIIPGETVAECEYCGSRQTVPTADNEKKLTLFARANRLRAGCEFDKAAGVYESIVADFPEEAEAYWGLVLCKYGIEYVDDPATGKKIPTCHRSSFDSILEDSDFEQACENADAVARKVYREEAKQIEELRKGIIAVSANEQPYDIFICYKETDENGDRTLDSVLAQDIYDALTDKGYRVFFSRITLEDKLGTEYEPYIFAALNSAKIMLAVGTDYEYYNAVWVKNEWSRYLKLMASDNSKHLIPCYKGIDAYDMPREFAKLQAQDLGKMGAIQDILRGIEKLLPKAESAAPVEPEKIVVSNPGEGSKIASLLDRGNMALEDGDWEAADSFFEDVLNNDSKNAQAYLGKTLAQEECSSLDELVQERLEESRCVDSETLYIPERQAHVSEMAEKYTLPGYVGEVTIRELYKVDRSYSSEVSGRQKQYQEEENWWQDHRWLSRAEKFAQGAVAQTIQNAKQQLFAQLNDRIRQAEQADEKTIAEMEQAYDEVLAEADAQAEKLYRDGLARRENEYQGLLERAKAAAEPRILLELASAFDALGDYQDSRDLAGHCRKRAEDEQARINTERERRRIIEEKRRKEKQAKQQKHELIFVIVIAIIVAVVLLVTKVIIPGNKYEKAEKLLADGQYEEAIAAFEAMDGYKDSVQKIEDCEIAILNEKYNAAVALMAEGKYEEAIAAFEEVSGFQDSEARIAESEKAIEELRLQAQYDAAVALADSGKTAEAAIAFVKLGDYQDARQRSAECWNISADRSAVSAGGWHTVGLKADGTVVAVGYNYYGQCDVSGWQDIVAVSAGSWYTVGLKSDGTVVAVGWNKYGQCNVSDWTDIKMPNNKPQK